MFYMVAVGMFALAACAEGEEGEPVALNERVFAVESMQSRGAGCYRFVLGDAHAGSIGGGVGASGGLEVRTRLDADAVVVSVNDGARTVVEKQYGESFFRSGIVDEFTAAPASGSGSLLLRYWGTIHPNGTDGCAPLDADGPP